MSRHACVLAGALVVAMARDAAAQAPPEEAGESPALAGAEADVARASAPPADEEPQTVRLPPVIVRAQKWEEDVLDIPQSVSVVDENVIENAGVGDISDAFLYVPNLLFVEFSARRLSFPFIRGIGSGQGDPAVTTYIDGVPQLSISSTNQPLLNVSRIEFLRGPQGTLYGRNSIGGLINVFTRPPTNELSFRADATLGNYELYRLNLALSGPIVEDELFFSLAGQSYEREGYTTNDFTGNDVDNRDTIFGRGQLLWAPDERNEIHFTLTGERTRDGGFALSDLDGLRADPYTIFQDFEGVAERDIVAPALTWTHGGDAIDVMTVSAYQSFDILETSDFDFSALDGVRRRTDESLDAFIQEVRVASADDAPLEIGDGATLKWQAGVLAFTGDSDRSAANDLRPGGVGIIFPVAGVDADFGDFDDVGVGVYGQVTLTLCEKLDLGAGLRYDYERKEADLRQTFTTGGFVVMDASQSFEESYDELVPRFSAAYRCCEEVTLYGLAAKGFQAGGFNLSAPGGQFSFGPETSWTYEGGVKTSLFDDRLRFNAAYFYVDWEDMQLSQFDAMTGGYVTNAGESSSQGVELELIARAMEGLDLFATFGYNDTEFESYVDQFGMDVSGNDLPFAPETIWSAGVQYTGNLGRRSQYYLRAEYVDVGDFFYDAGNIEGDRFGLANFRAGIGGSNWRVEGWIRNAFDDAYVPVAFQPNPADPTAFVGENGAPRTFGITGSLKF